MITRNKEQKLERIKKKQLGAALAILLLVFSLLCAVASVYYGRDVGPLMAKQFDGNGGIIGPLEVTEPNTLYEFRAIRSVPYGSWSFVGIELMNDEGEYLMGFGDEFWAETGYDSEGRWTESYNEFSTNVVIPSAGVHFIKVNVESPDSRKLNTPVYVSIQQRVGGVFLFKVFMVLGLLIGIFISFVNSNIKV